MKEPGESSTSPNDPGRRRRRRRRLLCCLVISFLLLLLLAVIVLILALTLFKPKDPTSQLVSVRVRGVSPRVSFPSLRIELNITLDLQLLVHNPNRASFTHAPGSSLLYYRRAQVGEAEIAAGKIPSRGSELVACALTLEAERFVAQAGDLVGDILAGAVGFDSNTRIPGRVAFLGFIKHHAVAVSDCHVVVGFPALRVRSQECVQTTKL